MVPNEMHESILTNMVYVPAEKIKSKKPIVELFYACSNGRCNFDSVETAVKMSEEVKEFGCTDAALQMVQCLKMYPHEFIPQQMDGFQLVRNNYVVVRLLRKKNENEIKIPEGRIGSIDYNVINFWDNAFIRTRSACPIM